MSRPVDPEGLAARFIDLEKHETTHDRLVWGMRQNRDKSIADVPEWAKLRELASQIKEHTLTHLDQYLEQFEQNATKHGTHVHWARDAEEHNTVVHDILQAHGVKSLIKSKSMLQEETSWILNYKRLCRTQSPGASRVADDHRYFFRLDDRTRDRDRREQTDLARPAAKSAER